MKNWILDYQSYTDTALAAAAEGQVLLENKNGVLPLAKGSTVSVFGRIQNHYYKSGTGSGGMVNVSRVIGIPDAITELSEADGSLKLYKPLAEAYALWEEAHPYDEGVGWGNDPWSQEEMPLTDAQVSDAAKHSDYALIIIGRTAGEDRDNSNTEGSYLLTAREKEMLKKVRKHFSKVIVILNVGNIIDMSFVREFDIDAVLYAWQGGMIGGRATVQVLTGLVNPSGALADTIASKLSDYPSDRNFGDPNEVIYEEDIFVGYRYFETFARDKVLYPFGYGLSYTEFAVSGVKTTLSSPYVTSGDTVTLSFSVKNIGNYPGKKPIMVYVKAPDGILGKSARVLAAFTKTRELAPGKSQRLTLSIPYQDFASFDETGKCGLGTGFLLEAGMYELYIGQDVRSAALCSYIEISQNAMLRPLENALGPVKPFRRMISKAGTLSYEKAPLRKDTMKSRRDARLPKALPITGDRGYKLKDVKDGRVSMDDFIAQLSADELCTIIRGEGMGSAQVTPGTASAFGGISPALRHYGIPVGCMDDGPSGMRLDSGVKAFSLPNGTLLACTFNTELVRELYRFLGIEMLKNKVDVILGPGMNIHRHPLNGRNFEYFSEDPYLTGHMGLAQFEGLQSVHTSGALKHFACNNQETGRQQLNPVVSERALREIYLKGFEIAVRGGADSVMTTYCPLNGVWTAGNYDLNTTILREQWGFQGIVMTDWWANISEEGVLQNKTNFAAMIRAQNDLYMCTPGPFDDIGDNARSSVSDGTLSIGELQRSARNICGFLLKYAPFIRAFEEELPVTIKNDTEGFEEAPPEVPYHKIDREGVISLSDVPVVRNSDWYFGIELSELGDYEVTLTGRGTFDNELAQLSVVLFIHVLPACSYTFRGTGQWTNEVQQLRFLNKANIMHFHFGLDGLELKEIRFKKVGEIHNS